MNPKVSPKSDPIVDERQALELQLQEAAITPAWRSGWRGVAIGIGVGVVIAGLGSSLLRSEPSEPPAAVVSEVAPSQTVTVASVQRQRVTRYLEATGSVAAFDLLPILPQEGGLQITEVLVDEGDYVEAGQVLAQLDPVGLSAQLDGAQAQARSSESGIDRARADALQSEAGIRQAEADLARSRTGVSQAEANADRAEASIAQAEARLQQADREYERFRSLAADGAISQQEADFRYTDVLTAREEYNKAIEDAKVAQANIAAAEADVVSAQARLVSARATASAASANIDTAIAARDGAGANARQVATQLDRTAITAPEGGLIVTRNARVGDVKGAASSTPLFEIAQGGRLELRVKVPETQLADIVPGSTVNIRSDADQRIDVRGVVRMIAPKVDDTTREAIVEIDLPPSDLLRPGMFLSAAIATGVQQGLTIPSKAVLPQTDGSTIVYTVNADNVVTAKTVKLGTLTDNGTAFEVIRGLESSDRVVVNGAGYVKDGDTVRVVE
ncbi:MAG: efflux RND transporter periplasmic adaptor subunit [Coleofasciculaceae cyanobacterium RL_1_1]|nr:efflux RND transporter periplasmic adaptor subunit [Coleofasciculaceae cyanobacterium RL_1_1]